MLRILQPPHVATKTKILPYKSPFGKQQYRVKENKFLVPPPMLYTVPIYPSPYSL